MFCPDGVSGQSGEHVWPRWFLRRYSADEGPFTLFINGEPQRDRAGEVVTLTATGTVTLPVGPRCNAVLENRFEIAAKPVVRRLLDTDGGQILSPRDVCVVAEWFVKTMLLLAHPSASHSHLQGAMLP